MRFVDYDIIFLALPRWDGPYSSTAFSLAKALSKHTRVFYVDNPFTIKEYWTKRRTAQVVLRKTALLTGKDLYLRPDKNNYPNLVGVTPKVTLPINWLPPGFLYDTGARINDHIMSQAINATCKDFQIKRYILINSFNPLFGRYLDLSVAPLLNIYQSVDDISQSPYIQKHGPRLEDEAVRAADLTLVTSSELKRLKSMHSPFVYLLPNAANTALFQQAVKEDLQVPPEIAGAGGKKIICYTGNICHRLDYELLMRIARHHADKILLMVGPFANDSYIRSGLSALPNVIFAGKKKIEELPAYLKHSHCCIIPFLRNQLTRSIYPLKINEYLSAGKPVVTTRFSEDIASFGSVACVSGNHDEFCENIEKAICLDSAERAQERVMYSAANSWESRAHLFIEITVEFMEQHDRGRRKPKRGAKVQPVHK